MKKWVEQVVEQVPHQWLCLHQHCQLQHQLRQQQPWQQYLVMAVWMWMMVTSLPSQQQRQKTWRYVTWLESVDSCVSMLWNVVPWLRVLWPDLVIALYTNS